MDRIDSGSFTNSETSDIFSPSRGRFVDTKTEVRIESSCKPPDINISRSDTEMKPSQDPSTAFAQKNYYKSVFSVQ